MIPKFKDYFYPLLIVLQDGKVHSVADIRYYVGKKLGLTDNDLLEATKGGRNRHSDRVKWAVAYLKKLALIESLGYSFYSITPQGVELLNKYGETLDLSTIRDLDGFRSMYNPHNNKSTIWVEGHMRANGSYVAGYYSSFRPSGIRKVRK